MVGSSAIRRSGSLAKRHGDHHTLPLSARQFVRVGTQPTGGVGQGDQIEQFERPFPGLALAQRPVDVKDLADLPLDGVQRVQGGHRLLEHHADPLAAHLEHLVFGCAHHFPAIDADGAARMGRVLVGKQLHHGQRRHRLAGTGLAHQRDRFAAFDREADAAHRLLAAECDRQVLDLQDRVHAVPRLGSKASRTPSPTKTSKVSMIASVKKPARPSHGAWMLAFPWASSSPSDG